MVGLLSKNTITTSTAATDNELSRVTNSLQIYSPIPSTRSPDIQIKVKDQIFNCHKLVLQLASGYFRQVLLASPDEVSTNGDVIDLGDPDVSPSTFEFVLRFIYLGTVEVNKRIVGDILIAADALLMPDLRQLCIDYMLKTVGPDNCFDYWRNLESVNWSNETIRRLIDTCRSVARTTFLRLATNPRPLQGATDSIVEMLLCDSCLQVRYFVSS